MEKRAFTLAEVLITLGIIGVVAAMTLPTLITKYREQVTMHQLEKAYNTMSRGYEMAVNGEEGTPDTWGLTGEKLQDPTIILTILSRYIKQLKICNKAAGCWPNVRYIQKNGTLGVNINTSSSYGKAIINDGMLMYVWSDHMANCEGNRGTTQEFQSVCATLTVDVNGYKLPNRFGEDTFSFVMTKYGIYPQGSQADLLASMTASCKDAGDNTSATNGLGCTAWVVINKNLDYLHCKGLSWNGKTSCN